MIAKRQGIELAVCPERTHPEPRRLPVRLAWWGCEAAILVFGIVWLYILPVVGLMYLCGFFG